MIIINDNDLSCLDDKECYILFYFTATWCKPCQKIKPIIEKISQGSDDSKLQVCMIDIDDNDNITSEFNIKSVPKFILYHKKKIKGECGGNINDINNLIKDNMKL
jgi:thioredoxin 1